MKAAVILQARTTSTRLPNKALLPVAGYPTAILAALRAANRRHRIILATSDDASDDMLAATAQTHGLEVFRGPLHDVLLRCAQASAGLPEDHILVRLTGDNVVPDGAFVEEIVEALVSSGAEYIDTDPSCTYVPYGLAAEAFTVSALRAANSLALSAEDREHVGPWMKRNCKSAVFTPKVLPAGSFSRLRCTLDDQSDYQRILQLFENIAQPVEIGWLELVKKLATACKHSEFWSRDQSGKEAPGSPFVLGTAQLGMNYGRVNSIGKPSTQSAIAIVRRAIELGVTSFDTARAYGAAECVIGEAVDGHPQSAAKIITKLDLSGLSANATEGDVRARVDCSVYESCRQLRRATLDTVLLHNWAHHGMWNGAAWRHLRELRDQGRIVNLGASVYELREAIAALGDSDIHHLQIPINVLDRRWDRSMVHTAPKRPDVIVHARSVLLQGILAHPADSWPQVAGFNNAACARKLHVLAQQFGREGAADLCFAYVRSLPWIAGIVVGCESMGQLERNAELFSRPGLSADEITELEQSFPEVPELLLNPAKWDLLANEAYAS